MSTELTTTTQGQVPALADTPAYGGLDGSDVALPKLYKGEYQSNLVQDEDVPHITAGCLFVASGPDDPAAEVIVKDAVKGDGVLAHFLAVKKGLSLQDDNDELQSWDFGDPAAPAAARETYTYFVCLPEVDDEIPVKVTLAKTSVPCAKRINFRLIQHGDVSAWPELAFRLKLKKRETDNPGGGKYRWFVWLEEIVETPNPEHVEAAKRIAPMAVSAASQRRKNNNIDASAGAVDQPAI